MNVFTALHALRLLDLRRPPIPGEHWLALGVGLHLLRARRRSFAGRALARMAGLGLVYRALSGHDGIAALVRPEIPRVAGRRTTVMDGTVIASAAEPPEPAALPARDVAGAAI